MRSIPCIEKNAFKNFSVGLHVTCWVMEKWYHFKDFPVLHSSVSCIISLQYSIIVVKSWQYIILYHGISKWGTLVLLSLLIFTSCLRVCKGKVFTLERINIQGNWAAHLTTEYSYKHNPLQVQTANGPDRYIMPLKTSAN